MAKVASSGLVQELMRDAGASSWTPLAAARRLVDRAGDDAATLQRALSELQAATTRHSTRTQRHALATLAIALAIIAERSARHGGTDDAGD